MANNKLNLPTVIPDKAIEEVGKTARAPTELAGTIAEQVGETGREGIRARRDVQLKQLDVAVEALHVISSVVEVWAAHKKLEQTRAEWAGRIQVAEAEVEKARLSLEEKRTETKLQKQQLDQLAERQRPIIQLLDDTISEISNAPEDMRRELRAQAIEMGKLLTELR
jgi:seryl-tRNA synthetase